MEYILDCENNDGLKKYFIAETKRNALPIIVKCNGAIFKVKKYIKASESIKKSKIVEKVYNGFFYDVRALNVNKWQEVEW